MLNWVKDNLNNLNDNFIMQNYSNYIYFKSKPHAIAIALIDGDHITIFSGLFDRGTWSTVIMLYASDPLFFDKLKTRLDYVLTAYANYRLTDPLSDYEILKRACYK
jgi:hypothetical protein